MSKNWDELAKASELEKEGEASQESAPTTEEKEGSQEASRALDHPDYKALEDKLTAAEMQAHENWDKATRALSELENFRKRSQREVENAQKYAVEKFATQLLPVIDSLEQALLQFTDREEGKSAIQEGVELTYKMFLDTLGKFSVNVINPLGEAFDPNHHEAMTLQEDPNAKPNTVLMVLQKGYTLHGRVIRPARVIVAKG